MSEKKSLNEEQLEKVDGGAIPDGDDGSYGTFHSDCKGKIANIGNAFRNCKCKNCGESHYWKDDFRRYIIKQTAPNQYMLEYISGCGQSGRREFTNVRPEELDWPCNQ